MEPHRSGVFHHQLLRDAEQLFSTGVERVLVLKTRSHHSDDPALEGAHVSILEQVPTDVSQNFEQVRIGDTEQMRTEIEANSSVAQHCFYLISQNTTWSHLNISLESFQNIADVHHFSDDVYDVVQAFGHRTCDIQQFRWSACRARLINHEVDHYEVYYRIQYPVRNNRNRGDPFSMRQTGVCQKSCGPYCSTWIILQPSPEMSSDLEMIIDDPIYPSTYTENSMSLHILFLSFQSARWDDYLEHLRKALEPLNETAHFSRVGRDCKYPDHDYTVTFKECQELQKFQWKLSQILPAIEGNIAVSKTCEERWRGIRSCPRVQASLVEVRGFIMQLEFHKESIRKLAEQAYRSAELLHKILDFRTSEQMQRTSTAMSSTLGTLDGQSRILTFLSKEREKDSKTMKALTLVATLYLPASLIATVFSSNIVQLLPKTSTPQSTHFVAAPQSWVPVVATVLLMALTLTVVRLLEKAFGCSL